MSNYHKNSTVGTTLKNIFIGFIGLLFVSAVLYFSLFSFFNKDSLLAKNDNPDNLNLNRFFVKDDCNPSQIKITDKTVILRVDDVQAYAWSDITKKMIKDAEVRHIPLTLGVIPKGLLTDVDTVKFLKQHKCNLEFALHGWDHGASINYEMPEFLDLSFDESVERMKKGLKILSVLTDEPIITWIPPENDESDEAVKAAKSLGMKIVSSEGEEEWDYDTTTFVYGDVNKLIKPEQNVAECAEIFKTEDVCIIMLHPQNYDNDYVDEESKKDNNLYNDYYLQLLDQLQAAGYHFARFKDFSGLVK